MSDDIANRLAAVSVFDVRARFASVVESHLALFQSCADADIAESVMSLSERRFQKWRRRGSRYRELPKR